MPRTLRMAALTLAAVFLAVSPGCRGGRTPAPPAASEDTILYQGLAYPKLEGGGTVRVLSHNDQLTAVKPLLQEVYGVTVEDIIVPFEQIPRKAEELIRAGQPVDLVYFTSVMYPLDLAKGLYLPLEDFVDFGDPIWSGGKKDADKLRYKGKLYIVPHISPDRYIWYNARLFREYGLETPLDSYRAGRWTWERLKAAADVFAAGEDGPYPIAGSLYSAVLASRDCTLLVSTPEGIRNAVLDEEVAFCIDFANSLYGRNRFLSVQNDGLGYFLAGKAAMLYEGQWYWESSELQALLREGDVGFVPPPRWEEQQAPIYPSNITGYLIPASVQNLAGSLIVLTCNQISWKSGLPSDVVQGMLDSGVPAECVDIYRQVLSADAAYGPTECNIFENLSEAWLPFEWMQYQAHSWNFVKRRAYYLFRDRLEAFNQAYR